MRLSQPCLERAALAMAQDLARGTKSDDVYVYMKGRFKLTDADITTIRAKADSINQTSPDQRKLTGTIIKGRDAKKTITVDSPEPRGGTYTGTLDDGRTVSIPAASVRLHALPEREFNLPQPSRVELAKTVRENLNVNREGRPAIRAKRAAGYARTEEAVSKNLPVADRIAEIRKASSGSANRTMTADYSVHSPQDVNAIFNDVTQAREDGLLSQPEHDGLTIALDDLLNKKTAGKLDDSQIKILAKVYGPGFARAVRSSEPSSVLDYLKIAGGLVRSNTTGLDAGGFRQGATWLSKSMTTGQFKKIGAVTQIAREGSSSNGQWQSYEDVMRRDATAQFARRKGLDVVGGDRLDRIEEGAAPDAVEFIQKKIETVKNERVRSALRTYANALQRSNRFHEILLSEMRLDTFNDISNKLARDGVMPDNDPTDLYGSAAHLTNMLTGRLTFKVKHPDAAGSSNPVEATSDFINKKTSESFNALSDFALAPRFRAARMIMADPALSLTKAGTLAYKGKQGGSQALTKEYAQQIGSYVTMVGLLAGAAKMARRQGTDVDFGMDPSDNQNFGKLRVGDKTYEFGGYARWLRMGLQFEAGVPYQDGNYNEKSVQGPGRTAREGITGYTPSVGKRNQDVLWQEATSGANPIGHLGILFVGGNRDPITGNQLGAGEAIGQTLRDLTAPIIVQNLFESATRGYQNGDGVTKTKGAGGSALDLLETLPAEAVGINAGDARQRQLSKRY